MDFEDIRPYTNLEFKEAYYRLFEDRRFQEAVALCIPHFSISLFREKLLKNFNTVEEAQLELDKPFVEAFIAQSSKGVTLSGIDRIDEDEAYMYIGNHRDITFDPALLEYYFFIENRKTSRIAVGDNLYSTPLLTEVAKLNKMIKVKRSGSIREKLENAHTLAAYIQHSLFEEHESVWIAQRNGRTKDGNDKTDQGIIKMFCMSKPDNKIAALDELQIVPVSVSYEWESCDILKAIELYESSKVKYIKKPGEDLNSILTGILQPKGRVHFQLCPIIKKEELQQFDNCTNNEYHKNVAKLIDTRILKAYKLWPNNFIAYDMLYGQQRFKSEYTEAEKITFEKHLCKLDCYEDCLDNLKDILLGIYANPVRNSMK